MEKNHFINFQGPALSLEQVAEKAQYVENTFASLRSKNKGYVLWFVFAVVTLSVGLYCLQQGYFLPHINQLGQTTGNVLFLLIFAFIVATVFLGSLLVPFKSSESIREKETAQAFGDEKIYWTWLSKASKDEMLRPAKSLADLKLFKQIMDHPAGSEFTGYIQGVLRQRDFTVYEQHFLRREFEAVVAKYDQDVALKDAQALRALLVSDPSQ